MTIPTKNQTYQLLLAELSLLVRSLLFTDGASAVAVRDVSQAEHTLYDDDNSQDRKLYMIIYPSSCVRRQVQPQRYENSRASMPERERVSTKERTRKDQSLPAHSSNHVVRQ